MKKILSLLLCLVLCLSLLPMSAFAAMDAVRISDAGVLTWDAFGDTGVYRIDVSMFADGTGTVTKISGINTCEYNLKARLDELKIETGTYVVRIFTGDKNTEGVPYMYVSPLPKLAEPQNLRWDGTTAKWDAVSNATEYSVTLKSANGSNQYTIKTADTYYDFGTDAKDGRWFEVIATADNYRDSNKAESPKYGSTYTITVTGDGNPAAYYLGTPISELEAGLSVALKADTAYNGRDFDKWVSNDVVISNSEKAGAAYFTMPAKAVTVTATYKNAVEPTGFEFTTQPKSGTAKKSEGYSFSWAISDTPDYYNLLVWWDGSWGGTGDTFLNGTTGTVPYVEAICTGNTSKYQIFAQKGGLTVYSDEFTVTWTDDTTPEPQLTPVSAVNIAGLKLPVDGEKAGKNLTYISPASEGYFIYEAVWVRSEDYYTMQPDDVFEAGKSYLLGVGVSPEKGYTLSIDTPFVFNGGDIAAWDDLKNLDGGVLYGFTQLCDAVSKPPQDDVVFGDVNDDGKINISDVTSLLKFLAKWDVKINESAADVNADGKINISDVTTLLKYLANWGVKLGK